MNQLPIAQITSCHLGCASNGNLNSLYASKKILLISMLHKTEWKPWLPGIRGLIQTWVCFEKWLPVTYGW